MMETLQENDVFKGKIMSSTPKRDSPTENKSKEHILEKKLNMVQPLLNLNNILSSKEKHNSVKEIKKKTTIIHGENRGHSSRMKIYEDLSNPDTIHAHCSRSTQTDKELLQDYLEEQEVDKDDSGRSSGYLQTEIFDLINEQPSENYWKELAEERRQALDETLEENEKLHNELEELRAENSRLSDIASQAESLQEMLQEFLGDDSSTEKKPDIEVPAVDEEQSNSHDDSLDDPTEKKEDPKVTTNPLDES